MATRKVLKDSDETLRKISKPVTEFDADLAVLLDDMYETMQKNEGAGLAGVQVGVLKRLFVMDTGNGRKDCINPEIYRQQGINSNKVEACLSVPGKCGIVERPAKVWVNYFDRNGNKVNKKLTGFEAKCFCHELDHLDGILYIDKATKMFKSKEDYFKYEKNQQKKQGGTK